MHCAAFHVCLSHVVTKAPLVASGVARAGVAAAVAWLFLFDLVVVLHYEHHRLIEGVVIDLISDHVGVMLSLLNSKPVVLLLITVADLVFAHFFKPLCLSLNCLVLLPRRTCLTLDTLICCALIHYRGAASSSDGR